MSCNHSSCYKAPCCVCIINFYSVNPHEDTIRERLSLHCHESIRPVFGVGTCNKVAKSSCFLFQQTDQIFMNMQIMTIYLFFVLVQCIREKFLYFALKFLFRPGLEMIKKSFPYIACNTTVNFPVTRMTRYKCHIFLCLP